MMIMLETMLYLFFVQVFINLCHSEKVAKPIAIEDPFRGGTQWEIPYSLGPAQDDKDKSMNHIWMYSMCLQRYAHPYDFHLKTIQWSTFTPQDWSIYTSQNNNLHKVQILWSLYQTFVNHWFWQIVIRCLFSWQGMWSPWFYSRDRNPPTSQRW